MRYYCRDVLEGSYQRVYIHILIYIQYICKHTVIQRMLKLKMKKTLQCGQQPFDIAAEHLRGFVAFDAADSSHAAGLTQVRVKHLERDMIQNAEQPCEKKLWQGRNRKQRVCVHMCVCVYKGNLFVIPNLLNIDAWF